MVRVKVPLYAINFIFPELLRFRLVAFGAAMVRPTLKARCKHGHDNWQLRIHRCIQRFHFPIAAQSDTDIQFLGMFAKLQTFLVSG